MPTAIRGVLNRVALSVRDRFAARRVYKHSQTLDMPRITSVRGATPKKLAALTDAARTGDIADALNLFADMESDDPRLHSLAATRRLALTGLDWEIVSAAESAPESLRALADEAAEFVREQLRALKRFDESLEHCAKAIGPNLAVCELLWEQGRIAEIVPIPSWRLAMRPHLDLNIRVRTDADLMGVVAESPGFLVHTPHSRSGSPLAGSLSEAQARIWLMKRVAMVDWSIFCQLFGMPVRTGKYRSGATAEEKKSLMDALANMGSAAWAMFSESCQVEVIESSARGVAPYEAFVAFLVREQSIAWLGAVSAVDTSGSTGTMSAAVVHDAVRDDLLADDIRRESRTIRDQLIAPMVEFQFPGWPAPLPVFRRVKPEVLDRTKEAQLIRAAQGVGVAVSEAWARVRLGIPAPKKTERILEPADAFVDNLADGPSTPV